MGITLVIPIYNEFGSLPILLKDLESQSNPGIAFLLVDNGSSDQSVIELLSGGGPNWESFRIEKTLVLVGLLRKVFFEANRNSLAGFPGI